MLCAMPIVVTTTSEPLRDLIVDAYHARGKTVAMPSTIDTSLFYPMDRLACRKALNLPLDACLVGTAGGLLEDRGIGDLYRAWTHLAAGRNDVHLVLAGPTDSRRLPPADDRVHYLGLIPHADTAKLFTALDVGVIYLRDTAFGRYCFPQKAFEMLACGLPMVAAAVGVMPQLLASSPRCLFQSGDQAELANAIMAQLDRPELPQVPVEDWRTVIGRLQPLLLELVV